MNAKILIVDDEENIRFTLKKFLITEGYEVATAEDYSQAMVRLKETDFDLIFIDIILKGKTGIDILKEIHDMKLLCLVVVITGAPQLKLLRMPCGWTHLTILPNLGDRSIYCTLQDLPCAIRR